MEEYKQIKNYPIYAISTFGNVKNMVTDTIVQPIISNNTYLRVYISKKANSKAEWFYIHHLVAKAFVDNPENKTDVIHINDETFDNNYKNLRWVNKIENPYLTKLSFDPACSSGLKGIYWSKQTKRWIARLKIDHKTHYIGSFETLEEAKEARQNKINDVFGEYVNACEK